MLGIPVHYFMADGCRHCGVKTTRETQYHCFETISTKILCRLANHGVKRFLVIHNLKEILNESFVFANFVIILYSCK